MTHDGGIPTLGEPLRTLGERRTLMRLIVSASLQFRYLVVAAAVALMVFGIAVMPEMRVDVFPEFAPPRVVIQTICLGLSTSDVEQLVTVPLEQSLNGTRAWKTCALGQSHSCLRSSCCSARAPMNCAPANLSKSDFRR